MSSSQRNLLLATAVIGFCAVTLGAFGAHALKGSFDPAAQHQYDLGIRYAFYHLPAMFAVAFLLPGVSNARSLHFAGWFFVLGVLLFSGSLLLLALSGLKIIAMLTPVGGLALLAGWTMLAYGIARPQRS